ncbi:hypothetical protein PT276_05890 [Orbaceae bacterium ESL0721]|nr:hypothetical protein [Orbaceae bacterium ESL0721]
MKKTLPLLFLPFIFGINQTDALLSASTANVINGNSPRFTKEIEDDIDSNGQFKYFGVVYNSKTYYDDKALNKALGANIATKTPNSLKFTSQLLSPTEAEFTDSDGDSQATLAEIKSDPINIDWFYENPADKSEVRLTAAQKAQTFRSLVDAGMYPYVKVWGSVELKTQYGVPNAQKYPDANIAVTQVPFKIFNVRVGGEALNFASPNMTYSAGNYGYGDTTLFQPTTMNGFVPQENYLNNFPSTGADGLFFYIITDGINNTLDTTVWTVETSNEDDSAPNAITATVSKKAVPAGSSGFKAYNAKNMVLVQLKGPTVTDKASPTAKAVTANLPVDIEVSVTTKQNVGFKYKFRITKWFINRGNNTADYVTQKAWCEGLGDYRLGTVKELSNATHKNLVNYPANKLNYYKRAVHEGFITEWGRMASYAGADFYNVTYAWSSTVSAATDNVFYVNMNDAALNDERTGNEKYYALCESN